jgi:hypothetical protein
MSTLFNAVNNTTLTENGSVTNRSSLDPCVDLFFKMVQYRREDITNDLRSALTEDAKTALQVVFWGRDCRGGAGERSAFRKALKYLANTHPTYVNRNIDLVPKYGRWDDVLELVGTPCEANAIRVYANALREGNGLAAKWVPRRKASFFKLAKEMGLSESRFRKLIVGLSRTVEQDMCAKRWDVIKYSSVPSVAMSRYGKAFGRNDNERFVAFINRVKEGKDTIKAGAVFPHDIVRGLRQHNASADVQWNALPDLFEGKQRNILPVIDVSGSMFTPVSGSIQAIDIAVGLGIYCAERNEGQFKNQFVTFSERPEFKDISKYTTLGQKMHYIERSEWGMNTNLDAVFATILNTAVKNRLDQSELPDAILIVSDMQFDGCINGADDSTYHRIRKQYEASGYKMPAVVFWNVNGRGSNLPVLRNDGNTALIGGYSPQVLKGVLSGDITNPRNVMLNTVSKYEVVI